MSFFYNFIRYNVEIALLESIIKIRGTEIGFSKMALLNLRKKIKINVINGKYKNIPIIMVIAPKFMDEFCFFKN